jgi:hypothetical protein
MRVWLFNTELGCAVEAELVPMTDAHIALLNATWVPEFHRRMELSEKDQDFLMWKTGVRYVDLLTKPEGVPGYVVCRSGDVQGVLALGETTEPSRLRKGERVLFVRYLAAAPWNRHRRTGGGRYRRTGTVLLGQAVLDSMAAGCVGRLGLHSLTASDEFYRKLGFTDLGPDPAERGLKYFELAATDAARLLRKTTHLAEPSAIFQRLSHPIE